MVKSELSFKKEGELKKEAKTGLSSPFRKRPYPDEGTYFIDWSDIMDSF